MNKNNIITNKIYYRYIKGMQVIKPLNYFTYVKSAAESLLKNEFNFNVISIQMKSMK